MNFYEIMFVLQFLSIILILGYRLWFILSLGKTYDMRMTWLLFIAFFIPYIIGFVIWMTNPEILIYQMLFTFETWLVPFNVLFLFIELFFHISFQAKKPISSYKSIDYSERPYLR